MQLTRDEATNNTIDQQRHEDAWDGKLHIGKTHDDCFIPAAKITGCETE